MLTSFFLILLGLAIGTLSGLIGIGGGVLFVPALVYLFGFDQYQAQGTTMALLVPPIGLLGAWAYYSEGHVDIKVAALICLGFVVGGFLGAKFAVSVPEALLQRVFGIALLAVAVRMIFAE